MALRAKNVIHRGLRAVGFDVVRWPASSDLGVHLVELMRELRINCVLDVGSHVGLYGQFLRDIGYRGRIVSFEPVTRNFELLSARARADVEWRVVQCAIGRRAGTATINVTAHPGMESLLELTEAAQRHHGATVALEDREEVTIQRLDGGILDDHLADLEEPRILLKSDTQGFDLEVVRGAADILERIPGLQLELSLRVSYVGAAGLTDALAELGDLGYVPTGIFSGYRDKRLRLFEVDCVFRREVTG